MASSKIEIKLIGLDEFKAQCEELREHLDELSEAIEKLPWYVRVVWGIKSILKLDAK